MNEDISLIQPRSQDSIASEHRKLLERTNVRPAAYSLDCGTGGIQQHRVMRMTAGGSAREKRTVPIPTNHQLLFHRFRTLIQEGMTWHVNQSQISSTSERYERSQSEGVPACESLRRDRATQSTAPEATYRPIFRCEGTVKPPTESS